MEAKIRDHASNVVVKIEKMLENRKILNLTPILQLTSGNIINDVIFGHTYDKDMAKFVRFRDIVNENFITFRSPQAAMLEGFPWLRHIPLWEGFRYKRLSGNMREFASYFINEIREHRESLELDETPKDFLTAYLQEMDRRAKKGEMGSFDDWQMTVTVADLWLAGMENPVTTLRWAMLYMILYPEVQKKVQEEIDSVIGNEKPVEMADRSRLPYTAATMNEIERKSNITAITAVHRNTEDVELAGHRIPKGMTILPQFHSVLADPDIYPEPKKFNPDRFLEADGKTLKKSPELVTFGVGKRNCM